MPALLAAYPFFIFMLIQFLRGIPKDLDESAKIDGADSFVIFRCILLPLMKPVSYTHLRECLCAGWRVEALRGMLQGRPEAQMAGERKLWRNEDNTALRNSISYGM